MLFYKIVSIILYALALPIFIFSAICMAVASFIHSSIFYYSIKLFCRIILLSFGIIPKINGSFPKSGTYIIMMNHSSFIDIFLYPLVPTKRWTGVTAVENFKYPILSYLLRRLHAIPIERKNKRSAIKSIEKAEYVLKRGIHIGILPEGSRTATGRMRPLKKGGFHMAINANIPIIPVGITGAFTFKPKHRWWIAPCPISINIGRPISCDDYGILGLNGLLLRVEDDLKLLSGEIDANK